MLADTRRVESRVSQRDARGAARLYLLGVHVAQDVRGVTQKCLVLGVAHG